MAPALQERSAARGGASLGVAVLPSEAFMRTTSGKLAAFALIVAALGGIWWAATRDFHHPATPMPEEPETPAPSTERLAPPTPAENKDLRKQVDALIETLELEHDTKAEQQARAIAKTTSYEELMRLFPSEGKRGIDPPGGRVPSAKVEQELELVAGLAPSDMDLKRLRPLAYQIAGVARISRHLGPPKSAPDMKPGVVFEFEGAADAFLAAVKSNRSDDVVPAVRRLTRACLRCHSQVAGTSLVTRWKETKTTEELIAIVKERAPDGEASEWVGARTAAMQLLAERGPKAKGCVPVLIGTLKEDEPRIRESALTTLRTLGEKDRTGRAELDERLKDESVYLRFWFAHHLAKAKSPGAGLRDALKAPDRDVRAKSAELLGRVSEDATATVAALKGVIETERDEEVRWAAAQALQRFKGADTVDPLLAALKDKDPIVRGRAAQGLVKTGKPAVAGLRAVLKETDRDVKASALGALSRMGPTAKDAVPELQSLLQDEDPLLRKLAGDALRRIDPQAAAEAGLK